MRKDAKSQGRRRRWGGRGLGWRRNTQLSPGKLGVKVGCKSWVGAGALSLCSKMPLKPAKPRPMRRPLCCGSSIRIRRRRQPLATPSACAAMLSKTVDSVQVKAAMPVSTRRQMTRKVRREDEDSKGSNAFFTCKRCKTSLKSSGTTPPQIKEIQRRYTCACIRRRRRSHHGPTVTGSAPSPPRPSTASCIAGWTRLTQFATDGRRRS